jgi:hypothetical protein
MLNESIDTHLIENSVKVHLRVSHINVTRYASGCNDQCMQVDA